MASLPEKDAEEDHGDVGLTISSNGQKYHYPLQSVYSTQGTEACGEPCQWPPILSPEDGPRQGKTRRQARDGQTNERGATFNEDCYRPRGWSCQQV